MNVNFSRFTWLVLSTFLLLSPSSSALINTSGPDEARAVQAAPTPTPDPSDSKNTQEPRATPAPELKPTPPTASGSTEPEHPSSDAPAPQAEHPEASSVPPSPPETPSVNKNSGHDGDDEDAGLGDHRANHGSTGQDVVSVFGNSVSDVDVEGNVVAVLGNSDAHKNVSDSVVAVLGNARTEQDVGQSVVAVLGNASANGHVHQNIVAVLGNIDLGPHAVIDGDVVSVGGQVHLSPGAIIHGHKSTTTAFGPIGHNFGELPSWFQKCLFEGRLLAFRRDVIWAWIPALFFLCGYVLFGLLFSNGVRRCAETFEQRPGWTILATILAMVLTPLLLAFLLITIFGGVFFAIAIMVAAFFGKAALYAWLGRRIYRESTALGTALAVLIGGVIFTLLFTIPVLGILMWIATGALGFGLVVYTTIYSMKQSSNGGLKKAPPVAISPKAGPGAAAPSSVAPATQAMGASAAPIIDQSTAANPAPNVMGTPNIPANPPYQPSAVYVAPPTGLPPVSALALPRAGFGPRLLASLLDIILVGFLSHILHVSDLFLLLYTAYCVCLWALKGTTVGGIICSLKIVRLDDLPIDWSIALIRALGAFLSLAVFGLGFLWVNFDEDAQSWHDKIAGTTIVRIPKGQSLV